MRNVEALAIVTAQARSQLLSILGSSSHPRKEERAPKAPIRLVFTAPFPGSCGSAKSLTRVEFGAAKKKDVERWQMRLMFLNISTSIANPSLTSRDIAKRLGSLRRLPYCILLASDDSTTLRASVACMHTPFISQSLPTVMDDPVPETTPFDAISVQSNKLLRVRIICHARVE